MRSAPLSKARVCKTFSPIRCSNLYSGETLVVENDDCKQGDQAGVAASGVAATNDANRFVLTLPGGNYTAIVRGRENTVGVGLVEVFNIR